MNLKKNTLITALGAALLLATGANANPAPACPVGKLIDVQQDTEFVPDIQVGQARRNKNGKDWTTVTLPSARKQTTYTVKVLLDGILYTTRSTGDFWAYNPSRMIVNTDVEACVESSRLLITRPDGKQYKPTIIRRERVQPASSGN